MQCPVDSSNWTPIELQRDCSQELQRHLRYRGFSGALMHGDVHSRYGFMYDAHENFISFHWRRLRRVGGRFALACEVI